eukprot:Skav212654  [mRNA]  locus=scaffold1227:163833:167726:+ [translate_table: standard]
MDFWHGSSGGVTGRSAMVAVDDWASWVCSRLGIELFIYDVKLARPHQEATSEGSGGVGCGLSREEYERYTKAIRFRSGDGRTLRFTSF